MSNINVKNFVDINIVPHLTLQSNGTRETVLLFSDEVTGTNNVLIKSLGEAIDYCSTTKPNTLKYLTVYFNNGGVNALLVPISSTSDIPDILETIGNEYICVACVSDSSNYSDLKEIAAGRANNATIYGVNEKIILARSTTIEKAGIKNFAVKYSSQIGAEMTIAAYLSKIDVYRSNTVYDYMFTVEKIEPEDGITDAQYKTIIADEMNVDITLANATRNCGGNCSDGDDITNAFVRIVLQQTVTDVCLQALSQKLKNQSGLNKIYSTIADELENYKTCGYLTTDKIWTDEDLFIEYNGKKHLIIEHGTAIQNGYFIKILPFVELSEADKQIRTTPPIYVILAEQYGIRKITINGEAI